MMSPRSTINGQNDSKYAVISSDVVGRVTEEVVWLNPLVKAVAVFVRDQVSHHVQVKLVEERFL